MIDREFKSYGEFAAFLGRRAGEHKIPLEIAAREASVLLENRVRAIYGDNEKLAHLAPSTQVERVSKGYTPNDPLLRDGALLRSKVERFHEGMTAAVGTPEIINAYHEFGYVNARTGKSVTPRPVFKIALEEMEPDVEALLQAAASRLLTGMSGFSEFVRATSPGVPAKT